ncbi:hypothetical protein NQ317_000691 [Molorchus minor]|uniref:Uncharacterized protein n=1 Tax=Molorchus minor TaxID=1323400 RepID=A0ABQ9JCW7_9CUCU|nr:hypothetical protein NQ317_000691 [Molorchus minor]
MLEESKDIIIKNFLTLMKDCNVDTLKDKMVNKGIFTDTEISNIFSTSDARHNKRVFFFNIQKKEQHAFNVLIELLKDTGQHRIAQILAPHSVDYNKAVDYYSSRAKKRGKLLIINNYDYDDKERHEFRNGATVDNHNLHALFNQMGGWEIEHYDNKTTEEIRHIINKFAEDKAGSQYDMCFVIVMAHGSEISNETIIFGIDGSHIPANKILEQFTSDKCSIYRGKPKVFLFQVCRGSKLDYIIGRYSETDSACRESAKAVPVTSTEKNEKITFNLRTQEDILVGYSTLQSYQAHRDPEMGSWYIELICQNFMKHAHNHSVDDLLIIVDRDLRKRVSHRETMQTPEYSNRGFRKLYLHPGIYYENGKKKIFDIE